MKDKVASPNKFFGIVSLREVGLKLTTCQHSFGGNPLIKDFNNSSSWIPTNNASSDMSAMYFSADSELNNFLFSRRVEFSHLLFLK